MRAINQHVLEYPTHAGRVGADHRLSALGQAPAKLLDVFEDPRTRPIQISAILEDHKHIRIAEHGLGAHGFHMRCSEQGRDNRIRDLVLNDIRRTPRPGRMHNYLHIGNVWQRVQRYPLQGPDTAEQQE